MRLTGLPVSACQRIGAVIGDAAGTGTVSTRAPAGRCSAADATCQPDGSAGAAADGNGSGVSGSTAATPADHTARTDQRCPPVRTLASIASNPKPISAAAKP